MIEYIGVRKLGDLFEAFVPTDIGETIVGLFSDQGEAALARDRCAIDLLDTPLLNFPFLFIRTEA